MRRHGIRLTQAPVTELAVLRREKYTWRNQLIAADADFAPDLNEGVLWEIDAEFALLSSVGPSLSKLAGASSQFGLRLLWDDGAVVTVVYVTDAEQLNGPHRTRVGEVDFHPAFRGCKQPRLYWSRVRCVSASSSTVPR